MERAHPANAYNRHLVADVIYSLASLHYHELHETERARVLLLQALKIEQELLSQYPGIGEYLFYFNNILRDLRDWFGEKALYAIRDHYTAAINDQKARNVAGKDDVARLQSFYVHRAEIHRLLAQFREALADQEKAGHREVEPFLSAMHLGQQGDYDQADRAVAAMAKNASGSDSNLYSAAQCAALLAAVANSDRSLAAVKRHELVEMFAEHALEWLRASHSREYFSKPSTRYLLADDRDLESLRGRADFQAFLAEVNRPPTTGK